MEIKITGSEEVIQKLDRLTELAREMRNLVIDINWTAIPTLAKFERSDSETVSEEKE